MNAKFAPRLLLLILLFSVFPSPAPAADARLFAEANALYQDGDFAGAERRYLEIASSGRESGALFYNLGNACFKQRKIGEAIYWWEKARRSLPGDTDVVENLELARLLIVDRVEVPEDPLPVRMFSSAVHAFSIEQESRIALGLFVAANAFFFVCVLAQRRRFRAVMLWLSVSALCLALLAAGSLGWKLYEREHRREAVVVAERTEVRSGPGGEYMTVVAVHEGIMVRVRGEAGGWVQVALPNGWSGWLPKPTLKLF